MKQRICSRTLRLPNKIFFPEIVFAKKIGFQFLRKFLIALFATLFLTGLLHPEIINARQSVGILSVNIDYPTKVLIGSKYSLGKSFHCNCSSLIGSQLLHLIQCITGISGTMKKACFRLICHILIQQHSPC